MRDRGFESLADGTLLLVVLLVASGAVLGLGRPAPPDATAAAARYVEDVRLALFRTTMDGLGYDIGGGSVTFPDGTTVETFLRIQVHLRTHGPPGVEFDRANARIEDLAGRILRPGWSISITGRTADTVVLRLPPGASLPATYVESAWTYPPLDGEGPDVRLSVAAWLNPR